MSDINNMYWGSNSAANTKTSTTSSNVPLGTKSNGTTAKKELDQADFMKLLTMQLSYQDPFKPVDNSQMLAQMTSMSTNDGINKLTAQMTGLNSIMTSSQALQASALVGQSVLTAGNSGALEQGGQVSGVIAAGDKASGIKVQVENERGELVREFVLNGELKGNVPFTWDGKMTNGELAPSGKYTFKSIGTVNEQKQALPALAYANVESVTLGTATSPTLVKLKGVGSVYLSDILEIAGSNSNSSTPSKGSA
ncbi:flagellar hook assembly protein FlgD [Aeromonas diversa]|uniref:flagellar hook assembly protein FlgD n=1 Tax=Aeromonas diversa TaxID=502790 RepID=UPI0039A1FCFC